jgi:DNA-binding CsgD family transcriptional regulator
MTLEAELSIKTLTNRQKEILRLISQHMQAKEVARLLNISERTVKTHTDIARKRLGVSTSRDAARLLAAYDAENAIVLEGRGPSRTIDETVNRAPTSNHEQAIQHPPHGFRYPSHSPKRSGDRLADARSSGQTEGDRGYPEHASDPDHNIGAAAVSLHDDRSDRMVDRSRNTYEHFEKRLTKLNSLQWLGLITLTSFLSALVLSGLIASGIATLDVLDQLNRHFG